MVNLWENIQETAAFLQSEGIGSIETGIVLGTGLGVLVSNMQVKKRWLYKDIPHFPEATVEFHKGELIVGEIGGHAIMVMQGRYHYYEGYSMQQITFPVRVMKMLGVKRLLLSNAAGGMNPAFKKGDLVMLDDHINLLPENPLRGLNDPRFGNRFVDMAAPYDAGLNAVIAEQALAAGIPVKKGIYVAVPGPNLETRAEYRHLRSIGADMVGMSTVPEVIVANHIGMACAAISVITDECDPDHLARVDISEIIAVAGAADLQLSRLMTSVLKNLINR